MSKFSLGDLVGATGRTADYRAWAVGTVAEIQITITKKGKFIWYKLAFVHPKDEDSWNSWFREDEIEEVRP